MNEPEIVCACTPTAAHLEPRSRRLCQLLQTLRQPDPTTTTPKSDCAQLDLQHHCTCTASSCGTRQHTSDRRGQACDALHPELLRNLLEAMPRPPRHWDTLRTPLRLDCKLGLARELDAATFELRWGAADVPCVARGGGERVVRRRVVGSVGVVSGRGDGSEEVDSGVSFLDRCVRDPEGARELGHWAGCRD